MNNIASMQRLLSNCNPHVTTSNGRHGYSAKPTFEHESSDLHSYHIHRLCDNQGSYLRVLDIT